MAFGPQRGRRGVGNLDGDTTVDERFAAYVDILRSPPPPILRDAPRGRSSRHEGAGRLEVSASFETGSKCSGLILQVRWQ